MAKVDELLNYRPRKRLRRDIPNEPVIIDVPLDAIVSKPQSISRHLSDFDLGIEITDKEAEAIADRTPELSQKLAIARGESFFAPPGAFDMGPPGSQMHFEPEPSQPDEPAALPVDEPSVPSKEIGFSVLSDVPRPQKSNPQSSQPQLQPHHPEPHPPAQPPSAAAPERSKIRFKVSYPNGEKARKLCMFQDQPFSEVYSHAILQNWRLYIQGNRIKSSDTPSSIGLKEGDTVDAQPAKVCL